jgi:hypothetical protein
VVEGLQKIRGGMLVNATNFVSETASTAVELPSR